MRAGRNSSDRILMARVADAPTGRRSADASALRGRSEGQSPRRSSGVNLVSRSSTMAVALGMSVHAVPAPLRRRNNGHPQIRIGEYLHSWFIDERVQRRDNVHVAVRSDRIGQPASRSIAVLPRTRSLRLPRESVMPRRRSLPLVSERAWSCWNGRATPRRQAWRVSFAPMKRSRWSFPRALEPWPGRTRHRHICHLRLTSRSAICLRG